MQFVPFNEYKRNLTALCREVLREIPTQLVQFFQTKKISPNMNIHGISNMKDLANLQGMSKMTQMIGGSLVNQVINKTTDSFFDL